MYYYSMSACKLINNMGIIIMIVLLIMNVHCMIMADANNDATACKPLHQRCNTTTGPPSGHNILECDEQGMSFPGDHLLPINSTATDSKRMRPGRILQSSTYADGSGTYITSDEVHHYASGVKCWSDYFVVESGNRFDSWVKASGDLYCSGTSSCTFSHMDGHQTCQTWSISISAGVQNEFVNFGITAGYDYQTCNTGENTSACEWTDGQCHCIWTQQQLAYQKGYKRRRCTSNQGDYTAWMEDIVHEAPTSRVNYGCGSKCTDT